VKVQGNYQRGFLGREDSLKGRIFTEGTVINWKPLSGESQFDFVFSRKIFSMVSSDFLGGIRVTGRVDFEHDYDIDWTVTAHNFALSNLDIFLGRGGTGVGPGRLDLDLGLQGSPLSPRMKMRARIQDGRIGPRAFKAMDVHLEGNCPTLKLTESRILFPDGAVMRFADKTLELKELFSEKTFVALVSGAQQDTVVWGDWEFQRPFVGEGSAPDFLVQRLLGDNTRLHFREYQPEEEVDTSGNKRTEFGIEYRLLSKDSLKFEMREDEKFVGVERKMRF
jgi:hypothetical protein